MEEKNPILMKVALFHVRSFKGDVIIPNARIISVFWNGHHSISGSILLVNCLPFELDSVESSFNPAGQTVHLINQKIPNSITYILYF